MRSNLYRIFFTNLIIFLCHITGFAQAPQINSFSPVKGVAGTIVTINGSSFDLDPDNNLVLMNGYLKAKIIGASPTSLIVEVPDVATSGLITVVNLRNKLSGLSKRPFYKLFTSKFPVSAADFHPNVNIPSGGYDKIVTADIDGDGLPDLLKYEYHIKKFLICRNSSVNGSLSSFESLSFSDPANDELVSTLATGDLDNDGKTDIVVGYTNSPNLSVFINQSVAGQIKFSNPIKVVTGSSTNQVKISDIDNDGKNDILSSSRENKDAVINKNTSTLTGTFFSEPVSSGIVPEIGEMLLTDIDGDNKPEIVGFNTDNGGVGVYRNASGSIKKDCFQYMTRLVDAGSVHARPATNIAVVDINSDGRQDIVCGNAYTKDVMVFRNVIGVAIPNSPFIKTTLNYGISFSNLSFDDIDGDAKPDLLALDYYNNKVNFFKNISGQSIDFAIPIEMATGTYPATVFVTDLNADGKVDIVTANTGSASVIKHEPVSGLPPVIKEINPLSGPIGSIVKITGSNFSTSMLSNTVMFGSLKAKVNSASGTDINVTVPAGAGNDRLTVLNDSTHLQARSGDLFNTTFTGKENIVKTDLASRVEFKTIDNIYSVKAADIDGDGLLDIVASLSSKPSLTILHNRIKSGKINAGSFVNGFNLVRNDLSNWMGPLVIEIADLNGDAKPDLIIANRQTSILSVYMNISKSGRIDENSFDSSIDFPLSYVVNSITSGDIDLDGKLDIVVAYGNSTIVGVLRNMSSLKRISLSSSYDFSVGLNPVKVVLRDLDGDGKPEIISASSKNNTVSVLQNESVIGKTITGYFAEKVDFVTDIEPADFVVEDFDGDRKPDIAVGYTPATSKRISVYRNIAVKGRITSTSFVERKNITSINNVTSIFAADLNGDGKLDLITSADYRFSVFKNKAAGTEIDFGDQVLTESGSWGIGNVLCADFNADGKNDLATKTDNYILIHENVLGYTSKQPALKSFWPLTGITGSEIIIRGENFTNVTQVSFGGISARAFQVDSDSVIVAVVGSGTSGDVKVTTYSGISVKSGFVFKFPPLVNYSSLLLYAPEGEPANTSLPIVFTPNAPISRLLPSNSGGVVPDKLYGTVTDIGGSGETGFKNGSSSAASFNMAEGIARDKTGNIFIADSKNNSLRKIDTNGQVTTIAGSQTAGWADGSGINARFNRPTSVTVANDGTLYVTDAGNNMIRKINANGIVSTFAGHLDAGLIDGNGSEARFNKPVAITVDRYNNLYVADQDNNAIRKIDTNGNASTLAGGLTAGSTDGIGKEAKFSRPSGIYIDASLDLYISDGGNHLIRKLSSEGETTTLAGTGSPGNKNGKALAASFNQPAGIYTDTAGNIFVADRKNYQVRKITRSGQVTTLAGDSIAGATNGNGGAAKFMDLTGITGDGSGNLIVLSNNKVKSITTVGFQISPALFDGLALNSDGVISGIPRSVHSETNYSISAHNTSGSSENFIKFAVVKPVKAASTFSYAGPWIGKANVAIDTLKPVLQGWTKSGLTFGLTTTYAGATQAGYLDSTLSVSRFSAIKGLAKDSQGNLYLADAGNNRIRKISVDGKVTTIAGNGVAAWKDGQAAQASFRQPTGIALDQEGNIYIADAGNNRIRKLSKEGIVTTVAGDGFYADKIGPALSSSFKNPTSIALDSKGNLFVADIYSNKIKVLTPTGGVATVIQNVLEGVSNAPDKATATPSPWYPHSVFIDKKDSLYVGTIAIVYRVTRDGYVTPLLKDCYGVTGMAEDNRGNFYLSQNSSNEIAVLSADGSLNKLAGSSTQGAKNDTGLLATFNKPHGIVWQNGSVYVSEEGNNMVRKVEAEGFSISPALPAGLKIDAQNGTLYGKPVSKVKNASYKITAFNQHDLISANISLSVLSATETAVPVVKALNPSSARVGEEVTIEGFNFNESPDKNIVYFGEVRARIVSGSATQIVVKVPASASYKPVSVLDSVTGKVGFSRMPFITTFQSKNNIQESDFDLPINFNLGTSGVLTSVKSGDFDGDGKTDIVLSHGYHIKVYRNISDPGKITSKSLVQVYDFDEGGYGTIVVEDFDGDGKLDFAIANRASNCLSVYRNKTTAGTISFTRDVSLKPGLDFWEISSGDFNGDGRIDICTSGFPDNKVSIFDNLSARGKISISYPLSYSVASGLGNLNVADLDGDGRLDIQLNSYSNFDITILKNLTETSCCTSFYSITIPWEGNSQIRTGDFDGDGVLDLAAVGQNKLGIFRNQSTFGTLNSTSFKTPVEYLNYTFVDDVAIADIDGDGKPDILTDSYGSNKAAIFRNIAEPGSLDAGSFAPLVNISSKNADEIYLSDIDGDGKVDLIFNNTINDLSIFRNNPKIHPVLLTSAESTVYKFSNDSIIPARAVDTGIEIRVAPEDKLSEVKASFSGNYNKDEDRLIFTPDTVLHGNINALFDISTGVLMLQSVGRQATIEQWGRALKAVSYMNTNTNNPNLDNRTIEYVAFADSLSSLPASKIIDLEFSGLPVVLETDRKLISRGTTIKIYGLNFDGVNSVKIGGATASSFVINSSGLITATVGDGASGDLEISGAGGSSLLSGLIYVDNPRITASGPTNIVRGSDVMLTVTSALNGRWKWQRDGVDITDAISDKLTAGISGKYTAKLYVDDAVFYSDTVTVTTFFSLPANNFKIYSQAVSCRNKNDGAITIEAVNQLMYKVKVSGVKNDSIFYFSRNASIPQLEAGNYKVEITLPSEPDFSRIFNLAVTQPENINVYSSIENDRLVLKLSGAEEYHIKLNGDIVSTTASSFSIGLSQTKNSLEVSSNLPCQGVVKELINFSPVITYPNPFSKILTISLKTEEQKVLVELLDLAGIKRYSNEHPISSNSLMLDLSVLQPGVYVLKLKVGTKEYINKVIKM